MSFILDALKKSETDRQRQASPALFEVKVAAPRRRFPVWAAALGVLLVINIAALVWVLVRPSPAASSPVAAHTWNGAPAANAAPAASQAQTQAGMVTVPATVTLPTTVQIPIHSAPSVSVGGPAIESTLPEEPMLESHVPAVPPDYDSNDYRPAITPEQAGAIAAARRSGALPSRDEVLAQGGSLPDLRLDLHVYATNPAERFVFINMRKLREGESLPEGVRVEQITPRGADLSYQGRRFSLERN